MPWYAMLLPSRLDTTGHVLNRQAHGPINQIKIHWPTPGAGFGQVEGSSIADDGRCILLYEIQHERRSCVSVQQFCRGCGGVVGNKQL